jgi:hypothetical protein
MFLRLPWQAAYKHATHLPSWKHYAAQYVNKWVRSKVQGGWILGGHPMDESCTSGTNGPK